MASGDNSENRTPTVWAIGPLPPPVNGMSLLTGRVVQRLAQQTPVTIANWSVGDASSRPHARALRILKIAGCLAKLVAHGRRKNGRLYLVCNSKGGLLVTGVLIKAARLLGYTIYLHHHAYNYIDNFDRKMAWCDKNMSVNDVHVMLCRQMIDDFRARYGSKAQFVALYPSFASLQLAEPRSHAQKPFQLGHISNLTLEKGLDLVLDTFRKLHERRRDVRLVLAGPFATPEAERLVSQAVDQFGEAVVHLGPVYDQRKLDFFNSIDCFLFPTRYDCEAWPIVVNEALDAGVPVIATNRGAIRSLVGKGAGPVVAEEQQYVGVAARQVETWMVSSEDYQSASRAAIEQADRFQRDAAIQLEQLITRICSPMRSKSLQGASVAV